MNVDAVMSLMRMSEHGSGVIANLARLVLSLVEAVRELETRAGMAELALETERAKLAAVEAALRMGARDGLSSHDVRQLAQALG